MHTLPPRRRWKPPLVSLLFVVSLGLFSTCGEADLDSLQQQATPSRYRYAFVWWDIFSTRFWQLESPNLPKEATVIEITRFPYAKPTPEQQKRADDLFEQSLAAAKKNGWTDYKKGLKDGFHLSEGIDVLHYVKNEHLTDGEILNPEKPEFLMYYNTEKGKKLAGFMFYTEKHYAEGPQIGGPLTIWHYHRWHDESCWENNIPIGHPVKGVCLKGYPAKRSPEMLHVWFVKHPEGQFATSMNLSKELLDLLVKGY